MPKTVGVAVSNATFHFDKLYTYAVLPEHQNAVRLGSMVLVPFGRGSKARMGVVLACDEEPEHAKLKYLFDVAPASACLTPELLRLVHFLKERTFCTYYEAVKAVIPYGAQYKPAVAADGVTPVLQKQLTRHTENAYKLVGTLPQKPKPTAKQLAAVALLSGGPRTLSELEDKGISRAVLDNLCTKGVLECSKVNKSIDLYSSIPLKNEPILLTEEQQAAYDALLPGLEDAAPHSALLYGVTGSGKTLLVQQQPNGVDLEGLARHRGSAFGRTLQPQLSQASFENMLAAEMLKTDAHQDLRLWVLEDESRMIGSNHLPECLRERMTQATIAVVEDPFEIRLERLNEEYFLRMHHDFTHAYGDEQGWQEYCEYLHHGLSAIKRRLGLQRYNELAARLDAALTTQLTTGSTDGHLAWLVPLLEEYYDPMYRYQLEKKAEKVVFRGEWAEVAEWVKAQ